MFAHTQFRYNNIDSEIMNVTLIKTSDGLFEQNFGYSRSIIEESVGDNFYFFGLEKQPLEFDIELAKIDQGEWTKKEKMKIINWLFVNEYKPFISMDYPDLIFYCMPIEECIFSTNGCGDGYVKIRMRCSSPYAYTPVYNYHFHVNGEKEIEIFNPSNININIYPSINIKANVDTDIKIIHNTLRGYEFCINNLKANEEVRISGQTKQIYSDKPKLKDFNKNFMKLICGMNRFKIVGNVDINITVDYPISV